MNIFEEVQKNVGKCLREDEDRKIAYLLYGTIPEELKCSDCRERLKRVDTRDSEAIVPSCTNK